LPERKAAGHQNCRCVLNEAAWCSIASVLIREIGLLIGL